MTVVQIPSLSTSLIITQSSIRLYYFERETDDLRILTGTVVDDALARLDDDAVERE